MTYLLIISIILHFFTFFWILLLTQKMNNQSGVAGQSDKIKSEIEDLLVAYTTEMKEDNEKIIQEISRLKKKTNIVEETPLPKNSMNHLTQDSERTLKQKSKEMPNKERIETTRVDDAETDYSPPIDDVEDTFEQSKTAQVLMLAKKGYSAKEIAKTLNMGDGEVELLLKFYQ